MSFDFRPAVRENVNLWINLVAGTGGGKTRSAMRLATGIANGKRFAVIDTENGRARHYADDFSFDVADLRAPFSPDRYADAIVAADNAGYPVIVVDSASHEWAGDGGCLDMQEEEYQRLGSKESVKMLSWARPKKAHKEMVSKLLQVKAHVILCFRAEQKVEMVKVNGKFEVQPKKTLSGLDGWVPITEKGLPFEATMSALLIADHPGLPHWIKLQEQHKAMFPEGSLLDEEAGRRIAEWAAGGVAKPIAKSEDKPRVDVTDYETILADTSASNLAEVWRDIQAQVRATGDKDAMAKIIAAKDKRKAELGL